MRRDTTPEMKRLAVNLTRARKARKLSRREAAEQSGVNEYTINGYELTPGKDASLYLIYLLAKCYGVPLEWLIEAQDQDPVPPRPSP